MLIEGCCWKQLALIHIELEQLLPIAWHVLAMLAVASFFVGVLGSVMGSVLGIVRLPIMIISGVDPYIAAGTNLFITLIVALSAMAQKAIRKNVIINIAILLGGSGVLGTFLGRYFAESVPTVLVLTSIVIFLFWGAAMMILKAYSDMRIRVKNQSYSKKSALSTRLFTIEVFVGFIIGILGGIIGVALGVIRIPIMMHVLKINTEKTYSTNLMITALVSLSGVSAHLISNRIDWVLVVTIGATAVAGMHVGRVISVHINQTAARIFTGLILLGLIPLVIISVSTNLNQQ